MLLLEKVGKFLTSKEIDTNKVLNYLIKYGYVKESYSIEDIANAIRRLRGTIGLTENENIDGKLVSAMNMPRCSLPDHEHMIEEAGALPKWGIRSLSYFVDGYDSDCTKEEWEESIAVALKHISNVCGLTFVKVSSSKDANLLYSIGRGRAHDFDGSSGTLAWFQLPPSSSFKGQLSGKFDADELWIPYSRNGRGIYLVNVACHETMHGLGVSHTQVPNSLINPFYSPSIDKPQREDIRQLNDLRYGPPVKVDNPVDPVPTPTPSSSLTINLTGSISKIEIPGYRITKIN